jgi:hypothetical protein
MTLVLLCIVTGWLIKRFIEQLEIYEMYSFSERLYIACVSW